VSGHLALTFRPNVEGEGDDPRHLISAHARAHRRP
jgi:hypothetical protein